MYSSAFSSTWFGLLFLLGTVLVCHGVDTNSTEPPLVTAPMEFPKNTSDYNLIQNNTILENLNKHDSMDTEVSDLNYGGTFNISSNPIATQSDEKLAGNVFTKENFKGMLPNKEAVNEETELIQSGHNEDELYNTVSPRISVSESGNAQGAPVPVVQGQLAAILAGVFVLIAAVGYSGLLAYRRYLENRYGSRDLLVNEDIGPFSL